MDNLLRDQQITMTADFTVAANVPFYFVDASLGDILVTLMWPSQMVTTSGKQARVQIKRKDSSPHTVTITTPAGLIEGNGDVTLGGMQSITFFSDRVNYFIQKGPPVVWDSILNRPDLATVGYVDEKIAENPGPQGPQGNTGPKGDKGDQGDTGFDGAVGLKGDKGDKGDAGNTGATGAQGIQGPKGDTGLQGAQGIKGDTGSQGPKGDTGNTGAQGIQGVKGDTGLQGIQGIQGATGPKGDKGDKGDTGDQGPQGIQGAQGVKGDTGTTGAAGTNATTTAVATTSANGLMSAADKVKLNGLAGNTLVGTVTIAETAVIAIAAGVRKVTVTATGAVVGGNYLLFPTAATPAGYALADVVCVTADQLQVTLTVPLIALGASYSISCRMVKINT